METLLKLTVLDSSADGAAEADIQAANTTAVQKSNMAQVAMSTGSVEDAIALHREALELKTRAFSEASTQAAISLNALGEAYLKAGRLDEADEVLTKALKVREETDFHGLGLGPRLDAAVTRDNLAALREAQGRFDDARVIRLKGSEKAEIMCGNDECPNSDMFALKQLQACAACRSIFYCSKGCQARDWRKRHKPLCQDRPAGSSGAS